MTTDEQINQAIHEQVMGWQWLERIDHVCSSYPYRQVWLFPPDSIEIDSGKKGLFGEPVIYREQVVGEFKPFIKGNGDKRPVRKNGLGATGLLFTTDLNAVALAEAKVIEKVGLRNYGLALEVGRIIESYTCDFSDYARYATATARQRSIAVLKAMEIEL